MLRIRPPIEGVEAGVSKGDRRQIVAEKTVDGKRARNSAAYRTRWNGNESGCTALAFRMQEIEPISRHTYVIGRLPIIGIFVDREQSADNSDLTTRRRDVARRAFVTHGVPVSPRKGREKRGRGKKRRKQKWTERGETPIVEVAPNTS